MRRDNMLFDASRKPLQTISNDFKRFQTISNDFFKIRGKVTTFF